MYMWEINYGQKIVIVCGIGVDGDSPPGFDCSLNTHRTMELIMTGSICPGL